MCVAVEPVAFPHVFRLPTETLLGIITLLDLEHISNFRQTCTRFLAISLEWTVWDVYRRRQQVYLPVLRHFDESASLKLSTRQLEVLVRVANRAEELWPLERLRPPFRLEKTGNSLLGLQIFLDQWLLVVYAEGIVNLWDVLGGSDPRLGITLDSEPNKLLTLDLGSKRWTSYAACLDSSKMKIFLAFTRALPPCLTRIYEVSIHSSHIPTLHCQFLREVYTPSPASIRAIEPKERLLVLSLSSSIQLVRWSNIANQNATTLELSGPSEDLEDLWNGIIGMRFVGPYILVFKLRSLELYDYVQLLESCASIGESPILKHSFISATFRDVSFASYQIVSSSDSCKFSLNILAYDAIQGLFQYLIVITVPVAALNDDRTQIPPSLDVIQIGICTMSENRLMPPVPPTPSVSRNTSPPVSPVVTPTIPTRSYFPRSSNGARGFVSTLALGPQGKRAIWVERKRGSTAREVHVWSLQEEDALNNELRIIDIPRCAIYSLASYDLRGAVKPIYPLPEKLTHLLEDLTHCTFCEGNGQIVLGDRSGAVLLLRLG